MNFFLVQKNKITPLVEFENTFPKNFRYLNFVGIAIPTKLVGMVYFDKLCVKREDGLLN